MSDKIIDRIENLEDEVEELRDESLDESETDMNKLKESVQEIRYELGMDKHTNPTFKEFGD